MITVIRSLPLPWAITAYVVLGWGLVVVMLFVGRYTASLPWYTSEEGRHLVAMSANIGAFFLVYLAQVIWPDMPFRRQILIGLLVLLVANCTWRWIMLERCLAGRRRDRYRALDTDTER